MEGQGHEEDLASPHNEARLFRMLGAVIVRGSVLFGVLGDVEVRRLDGKNVLFERRIFRDEVTCFF